MDCGPGGLTLAGVSLLKRDEQGFSPRHPQELHWLVTSAYGQPDRLGAIENGLAAVARALNEGKIGRAMIAAVLLKLPALDWDGAARIAQADDLFSKYDPDEPRDWRGRWTDSGTSRPGSVDELDDLGEEDDPSAEFLTLPPGHRIDELGHLLEWIANANPEEAPIIRSEIKRYYYDVGDVRGGNALNLALSNIVYEEPTQAERQDVLDTFEVYTRADPAEIAQIGRDLLAMALAHPPIVDTALAEAAAAESANAWAMGWSARGLYIEQKLGGNLPAGFPVVDRFADGVVTSIKSIDLRAAGYQNASRLKSIVNGYVDRVARFNGNSLGTFDIDANKITGRALNLAVPEDSLTSVQRRVLDIAKNRAKSLNVDLIVTPF